MNPLLAVTLSTQSVVLVVAVCVAALALGVLLFKKDTEIENRRRHAIEAGSILQSLGLVEIPKMLTDYAVGDYSGLVQRLRDSSTRLLNPANIETEFNEVFSRLLDARLKDPARRKAFLDEVQKKAAVYNTAS